MATASHPRCPLCGEFADMCSYKELADAGIEPLIYGKTQSQMTTTEWRRRIKRYCLHNHSSSQEWAHILPDVDRSLLAAVTDGDGFRISSHEVDLDTLRNALSSGADVNTITHYRASVLYLAVCKTCPPAEMNEPGATQRAVEPGATQHAVEAVAMLLEAGADPGTVGPLDYSLPHCVTLMLLRAGRPIDYDYLRSTETDNYSQFTKAAFQHRVHEAGGFHAYKEGRYGRMKALRLIARDHRIPDELVSVMLGFLANRTLHDADFSSYSKFCIENIHDEDSEDYDDSDSVLS